MLDPRQLTIRKMTETTLPTPEVISHRDAL